MGTIIARMGRRRRMHRVLMEKLEGKEQQEDLDIGGRILKCILQK
jgi:hypothetical protein